MSKGKVLAIMASTLALLLVSSCDRKETQAQQSAAAVC